MELKIIILLVGIVAVPFAMLFFVVRNDIKKVDNAWKIIDEFEQRISNIISINECNLMLKEMDTIFLTENKKMIKFRLPLQIKKLYHSVYDKLELLSKSNLDCVYEFIYTECTYDSNYRTISVHRTKKGAYNEMRTFLIKQYMDWYNDRIIYGKYAGDKWYGENERWSIHTTKLKD